MDLQLLTAESLGDGTGYTWTLASRLGDMLWRAEQLYGSRDPTFTILGIEFIDGGPKLWYPGNRKHIVIQLSLSASNSATVSCWQLAHECIHLLAPNGGGSASVLEEGLAVAFSHRYIKDHFDVTVPTGDVRYDHAEVLFHAAEEYDAKVASSIHTTLGRFSNVSADELLAAAPTIPRSLCEELVSPFTATDHPT